MKPLIITLAFPILFGAFWFGILHVLSWVSGWKALGREYAATAPFHGKTYAMQNGWVGFMGYGWSLTVGGNEEGFYMAVMHPFRIGQPPLFARWSDVQVEAGRAFLGPVGDIRLRKVPKVRIRLFASLIRKIAETSGGGFELPPGLVKEAPT